MTKDVGIWMPVYVGDMLANTTRLNTEQIGALNLMMLDYWRSGAIPDDAQVISSITRMTTAKVKNTAVQCCLVACLKFPKVSGLVPYLDGLRDAATENKKEKSERAVKAAEARWGKRLLMQSNQAMQVHHLSNAQAMHKQCLSIQKQMLKPCLSNAFIVIVIY